VMILGGENLEMLNVTECLVPAGYCKLPRVGNGKGGGIS
jgi:hypothetical protein